jgi:hypothetical protein
MASSAPPLPYFQVHSPLARARHISNDWADKMKLPEINAALEELRDADRQRIEIEKTGPKEEEVTIFANREGLIRLAAYCLDLAERQLQGAHHHLDEVSVYEAAVPVVISFRKEPNQPPQTTRAFGPRV